MLIRKASVCPSMSVPPAEDRSAVFLKEVLDFCQDLWSNRQGVLLRVGDSLIFSEKNSGIRLEKRPSEADGRVVHLSTSVPLQKCYVTSRQLFEKRLDVLKEVMATPPPPPPPKAAKQPPSTSSSLPRSHLSTSPEKLFCASTSDSPSSSSSTASGTVKADAIGKKRVSIPTVYIIF